DPGVTLQIAMIQWKMRNKPEEAEPHFERLRKVEPAHPGMLEFFRQWTTARGDTVRMLQVLADAQRVMAEGPERAKIVAESARLAEEGANAAKAIEQWRALLRREPNSDEAKSALRRLYTQTGQWNALADLLRADLEAIPQNDVGRRLPILRRIASVYR